MMLRQIGTTAGARESDWSEVCPASAAGSKAEAASAPAPSDEAEKITVRPPCSQEEFAARLMAAVPSTLQLPRIPLPPAVPTLAGRGGEPAPRPRRTAGDARRRWRERMVVRPRDDERPRNDLWASARQVPIGPSRVRASLPPRRAGSPAARLIVWVMAILVVVVVALAALRTMRERITHEADSPTPLTVERPTG
jgi:hypothetical protein